MTTDRHLDHDNIPEAEACPVAEAQPSPAAVQSRFPAPASGAFGRRVGSLILMVVGILAWAVFAVASVLAVAMMQRQAEWTEAQRARLEVEGKERVRLLTEEGTSIGARIEEAKAALKATRQGSSAKADECKVVQQEIYDREHRLEALTAELHELQAETAAGAGAAEKSGATAAVSAKPAISTAETVKKLETLKKQWAASCHSRKNRVQAELISGMASNNPVQLQKFYRQYILSPFAPAALFFSAEAWYRKGDLDKAWRNYSSLIAGFPYSGYCGRCTERLVQLEEKRPFTAADVPIMLYTPGKKTEP